MKLNYGIASPSTITRMLSGIDEELALYAFMEWIGEIVDSKNTHLAIDGKALRGAAEKTKSRTAPMLLNVVETVRGLILAQLPVDSKTNEITVIPELLKLLDIRGSVITIDAIGTQTAIMEQIHEQEGQSQEIYPEIHIRQAQHIRRGIQKLHDVQAEFPPDASQHQAQEQESQEGRIEGLFHLLELAGAKIPADLYGGPDAASDGNPDEDIGECVRGAHRCQGLFPHIPAHNGGVGHGIGLLEEVPDDHGESKIEQGLQGILRDQIVVFHGINPPPVSETGQPGWGGSGH